ncbi:MAG TPA: hypothetical protein VIM12_15990 [Noviherbaspirillum sp.]|jgi:hypothetical protein|uniref:hypothetical protein n=1 Tax=Noviherbaspirillum sp. TaxID=1926288 RepID=UPI002F93592D
MGQKASLCEELERIDAILERLRHRHRIGPDVSVDDLVELFCEERDRLFAQLQKLDATVAEGELNPEGAEHAYVIEFRPGTDAGPRAERR